jgi:hypothetical protein
MPSETKTTPLQQTAVRIRAGNGTKENARLIDQEFQRVKWQRIRELKRQTRSRIKSVTTIQPLKRPWKWKWPRW